jgi:hypothetical protein
MTESVNETEMVANMMFGMLSHIPYVTQSQDADGTVHIVRSDRSLTARLSKEALVSEMKCRLRGLKEAIESTAANELSDWIEWIDLSGPSELKDSIGLNDRSELIEATDLKERKDMTGMIDPRDQIDLKDLNEWIDRNEAKGIDPTKIVNTRVAGTSSRLD